MARHMPEYLSQCLCLFSGRGEHIRLSMLDATISFLWPEGMERLTFADSKFKKQTKYTREMVYSTKDGKFVTCGAVTDTEWSALCTALKKPEWITDPRFSDKLARSKNANERYDSTDVAVGTFDLEELLARFERYDVPHARVNYPLEAVLEDAQVQSNQLLFDSQHPIAGTVRQPRAAARFSSSPFSLRRVAPGLGQHTREVLVRGGVVHPEEYRQLLADGVVVGGDEEPLKPEAATEKSPPFASDAGPVVLWGEAKNRSARCVWALHELGVAFVHHAIGSRDGSTQTPEFLALNPAGKVPVLQVRAQNDTALTHTASCARKVSSQHVARAGR